MTKKMSSTKGKTMTVDELLKRYQAGERNFRCVSLVRAKLAGAKLAYADLTGANLTGADLTGADLTDVRLAGADLTGAILTEAILTGADLTGADLAGRTVPIVEDLDRKMAEVALAATDSLNMCAWHSCETTHCRAGWAITLAGTKGAALERAIGPSAAGAFIYFRSVGYVPDFFTSTSEAAD